MRFASAAGNSLLIGESGTGKELVAQAIHNRIRPNGPFIALNCAALPRNLVESELFGYERGAFSGAEKNGKPGKIELANGGTLFLDEIGDIPYEIQSVLLRVLEDKKVMRLGGSLYNPVDFRLITATNKDLYRMVEEKFFRSDLFFRLSAMKLDIPPLRDRRGDVALLMNHFISGYSEANGLTPPKISQAALQTLLNCPWPGNVRQLENTILYAVNVADGGVIGLEHLPKEILRENENSFRESGVQVVSDSPVSIKEYEQAAIRNALVKANHNVPAAAKLLKISKATLYRKLQEYPTVDSASADGESTISETES
jgi:transcriptional regulator with PAS, ATPase and Fis domain